MNELALGWSKNLHGSKASVVDEFCPEYFRSLDVAGLLCMNRFFNIAWWSGTVFLFTRREAGGCIATPLGSNLLL